MFLHIKLEQFHRITDSLLRSPLRITNISTEQTRLDTQIEALERQVSQDEARLGQAPR